MSIHSNCHISKLFLLLVVTTISSVTMATSPEDKVEPQLLSKLNSGEKANIMVKFGDTAPILDSVQVPANASRGDKATAINKALNEYMTTQQQGVAQMLTERKVEFKQFWISNSLSIQQADKDTVLAIAADPNVTRVNEEAVAHLLDSGNK